MIEIGDDSENWVVRKEWLNSVLNELWTARGPYPGFPSVLECVGLKTLVSSYTSLTTDSAMKDYRNSVKSFLDGETEVINGLSFDKNSLRKIRREYQLLGKAKIELLFDVLARFDISADQMKAIISDDRENVSIEIGRAHV